MQNVNQMLGIINATTGFKLHFGLGSSICNCPTSDTEELGCEYPFMVANAWKAAKDGDMNLSFSIMSKVGTFCSRGPFVSAKMIQWLRKAQDVMSSMASNYDMFRLIVGQVLAVVAGLCALLGAQRVSAGTITTYRPFFFVTAGYGTMMFASSYVEEEQHFWYWATTAWLTLLGLKNCNG
jgi:ethanolaminephosphotransferase